MIPSSALDLLGYMTGFPSNHMGPGFISWLLVSARAQHNPLEGRKYERGRMLHPFSLPPKMAA